MEVSVSAQLLAISVLSLQRQILHNNNVNRSSFDSAYDYIVVGSGSSGAVVANRLAAYASIRVLLLEAGGPQTTVTDMPALAPALLGTEVDWQYRTVPQSSIGQSFLERRIRQPKGDHLAQQSLFSSSGT